MDTDTHLWPIAVVQDRYSGVYSGGAWIAVANADEHCGEMDGEARNWSRLTWLMHSGAYDDDTTAMEFWDFTFTVADPARATGGATRTMPKDWIAVGDTPDAAVRELHARAFEQRNGVRPGTRGFGQALVTDPNDWQPVHVSPVRLPGI